MIRVIWMVCRAVFSLVIIPAAVWLLADLAYASGVWPIGAALRLVGWLWIGIVLVSVWQQVSPGRGTDLQRWLSPRGWRAAREYNFGTAALMAGNPALAVGFLSAALRDWPRFAEAAHNLGNAQLAVGLGDAALESFDYALALRERFPEAHNNRGRALVELGRLDDAIAAFDRAIAIAPGYQKAIENRTQVAVWRNAQ